MVRHDEELDLALLRLDGVDELSALTLGSAEDMQELVAGIESAFDLSVHDLRAVSKSTRCRSRS